MYSKLTENRDCICIQGAVAPEEGVKRFRKVEGITQMLSGIEVNYDPRHVEWIESDIKKYGGSYEMIDVNCFKVNDLLEKYGLYHIDYLSLDIEGGELEILKSIDFDRFYVFAISVENNYETASIRKFLTSKGFKYVTKIDVDELYVNMRDVNK